MAADFGPLDERHFRWPGGLGESSDREVPVHTAPGYSRGTVMNIAQPGPGVPAVNGGLHPLNRETGHLLITWVALDTPRQALPRP